MSAIIKSVDRARSASIVPIGDRRARAQADAVPSPELAEIAALRNEVASLRTALAARDGEVARAFEDGETRGRAAGRADAVSHEQARLTQLEHAAMAARDAFDARLAALDRLAPLVACAALEKLIGSTGRADLLIDLVAHQIALTRDTAIVRLSVSAADFGDRAAIDALESRIGARRVEIDRSDELPSGDCQLSFRLGRIDIGIGQQWGALRDALTAMALGAAA